MNLKASPDGCEEAALISSQFYIPCNRPAVYMVGWNGRRDTPIRMCKMCADHNVRHRGGKIVNAYISKIK